MSEEHDQKICTCQDCSKWRTKRKRATKAVLEYMAKKRCVKRNCGTVCKCEPCMARQALELY